MSFTNDILLDEEIWKTKNEPEKKISIYNWLHRISASMNSGYCVLDETSVFLLLQQLKTQVVMSNSECIRRLLAKCLAKLCHNQDTVFTQEVVTYLQDFFKAKSETPMSIRLNSLTCLGEIHRLCGLSASYYGGMELFLTNFLKSSECTIRIEAFRCFYNVLEGLQSNDVIISKDLFKWLKKLLVSENNPVVKTRIIQCLRVIVTKSLASFDFPSMMQMCVKSLKIPSFGTADALSDLITTVAVAALRPPSKNFLNSQAHLPLKTVLNYLSPPFFKRNTIISAKLYNNNNNNNNKIIRMIIGLTIQKIAYHLGDDWFEKNYFELMEWISDILSRSSRSQRAKSDTKFSFYLLLHTVANCFNHVSFGLIQGVCRDTGTLLSKYMQIYETRNKVESGVKETIIMLLLLISLLVEKIGSTATPLFIEATGILETVFECLSLSQNRIMIAASWCLKCIATYIPGQLATLTDRCLKRLEHLRTSYFAVEGYSFCLASLAFIKDYDRHMSPTIVDKIRVFGKELFEIAADVCPLNSLSEFGSTGWILLYASINFPTGDDELSEIVSNLKSLLPENVGKADKLAGGDHQSVHYLNNIAGVFIIFKALANRIKENEALRSTLLSSMHYILALMNQSGAILHNSTPQFISAVKQLRLRVYQFLNSFNVEFFGDFSTSLVRELVADITFSDLPSQVWNIDAEKYYGINVIFKYVVNESFFENDGLEMFNSNETFENYWPSAETIEKRVYYASNLLLSQMFFKLSSEHQLQILRHFSTLTKRRQSVFTYNAIMSNISTVIHDAAVIAMENNLNIYDVKVVHECLNLLNLAMQVDSVYVKTMTANAIGRLLSLLVDDDLTLATLDTLCGKMRSGALVCRSVSCYTFSCIRKYTNITGFDENSASMALGLAQDCSCESAQIYAIKAVSNMIVYLKDLRRTSTFISSFLSLLLRPSSPSRTVLLAIGEAIISSVDTLAVRIDSKDRFLAFSPVFTQCADILIEQEDDEIQTIALKILVRFHTLSPDYIEKYFTLIPEFLWSKNTVKQNVTADFLDQIICLNPYRAFALTRYYSSSFVELFHIMDYSPPFIQTCLKNVLLNIARCPDIVQPEKWLATVKNLLTGRVFTRSVILSVECTGENESDIANLNELSSNDYKPVILFNWRTRVFALELVRYIMSTFYEKMHTDMVSTDLEVQISEIIKLAFFASTNACSELRNQGLSILYDVIRIFTDISDPEFPNQSILEQYQAQVSTAIFHALNENVSREEFVKGCELFSIFIKNDLGRESNLRLFQCLVSKLEPFQREEDTLSVFDVPFLKAWAVFYNMIFLSRDNDDSSKKTLKKVIVHHLEILTYFWFKLIENFDKLDTDHLAVFGSTIDWSSIFLAFVNNTMVMNLNREFLTLDCVGSTMLNRTCRILNSCTRIEGKSIHDYLRVLHILLKNDAVHKDTYLVISKSLCSLLCLPARKHINLIPELLSVLAATKCNSILADLGFSKKLVDFIRGYMHYKDPKILIDVYKSLSCFFAQEDANMIIFCSLMDDFSKLLFINNYPSIIKKDEEFCMRLTAKFVEIWLVRIEPAQKTIAINMLVLSTFNLIIENVANKWNQCTAEARALHIFALSQITKYASSYPLEMKTILSHNEVARRNLEEAFRHKDPVENKKAMIRKQQPSIELKHSFSGF